MRGIDVSYAQGVFNWDRAAGIGVGFAMIKATQGRLENDTSHDVYDPFTDFRFTRNVNECIRLGIPFGTYHYLTAYSEDEARLEAEYFCSVIRPYSANMTLWAAVDLESRHLTNDRDKLTAITKAFTDTVAANGFRPMIYTNPNWLRNRINRDESVPLWLALWNSTEENARAYDPAIWQYGLDTRLWQDVDGDMILDPDEEETEKAEEALKEKPKARYYKSWDEFDARELGIETGEIFFRECGIFQEKYDSWTSFKDAENEKLRNLVGPAEIVVIPIIYNGGREGLVADAYPLVSGAQPEANTILPGRRTRVRFVLGGENISNRIFPRLSSLTYTDADADEADDLQFTLVGADMETNEELMNLFLDNTDKALGVTIVKETGAPDGTVSQESLLVGNFYVDEVSETIAPCRVTVKATSIALTDAAKKKNSRSWAEDETVTLLFIANAIATNLGLILENQGTRAAEVRYGQSLMQNRQTDLDFLSSLCTAQNITIKVSNGRLMLLEAQRDALENAVVIRPQDCSSVSFSSGSKLLEYRKVTVSYTDPFTQQLIHGSAYNLDIKGGKSTTVYIKVSSDAEAKALAENILKSYNRFVFTASLTLPGTLKLASGNTVMLDGFGGRDGRYTITQVKQKVSTSGFTTSVDLREWEEEEK